MTYTLGVDLGTTYSAAAVARDGRVEVCTLGTTAPAIPSVVVLRPDGEVLVGEAADRRSLSEPSRTAREFKRRLGDPTPIVLGGTPYGAESLMAHLLKVIVAQVTEREGDEPARIVLTHPANYGQYKLGLMQEAARLAGLDLHRVHYVSEPQAAAVSYAQSQRVEAGEMVAVYDFGGGTFDAAVVRRTDQGFELMGTPEGMERLGGIDVDAAVLAHVNTTVDGMLTDLDTSDPSTRSALSRLRDECREAKEALSTDTDTTIPVSIPGLQTEVRLTREELEGMIRPRLNETVDALVRAVSSAGLTMDQVSRILLVGGTSRIPLVGQLVREATGRPIAVDAHPKLAIASGAALLGEAAEAAGAAAPVAGVAPPEPSPPVATPGPPPSATAAGRPAAKGGRKVAALVVGGVVGIAAGVGAIIVVTGGGGDDSGGVATTAVVTTVAGGTTVPSETTAPGGTSVAPGTTVTPAVGAVQAFAGNGQNGTGGEGGPATEAQMERPENVAASSAGEVFIADNSSERILKVSGGVITKVRQGDPNKGESGTFGVAVAPDDSVWFSDAAGVYKLEDGKAVAVLTRSFLRGAQFGLGFDDTGNLFVAEGGGNRVVKLDLRGTFSVVAGTGEASPPSGGVGDGGSAKAAQLGQPVAVAVGRDDSVYIAESFTRRIRKVDTNGTITTFAGGGSVELSSASAGTVAADISFSSVTGVAVDRNGNIWVADFQGRRIARFDSSGKLAHVAGGGNQPGDGKPASETLLDGPGGMVVDNRGTLIFTDGLRVRRIDNVA